MKRKNEPEGVADILSSLGLNVDEVKTSLRPVDNCEKSTRLSDLT